MENDSNNNNGITIDNKYIISVLEEENNKLIQENRLLRAYIQQLEYDSKGVESTEPTSS